MLSPNHLIGGIVFTGTFGALLGENIFQTKLNIICVVICSQLPDIDHKKAPISKLFFPLSWLVCRYYEHRTITHTLWALLFIIGVAHFTGLNTSLCGLSYFSHILFDMMTLMGVPFMYPFSQRVFVIPENPRLRFRTNDYKSEMMIFGVFCGLSVFTYPLMSNGFWTTYNNSFGTLKTLHSEFTKSKDILQVNYKYQIGSQIFTGKGLLVDAIETKSMLLDSTFKWLNLNEKDMIIKDLKFVHTNKPFKIERFDFIAISIDSLNQLVKGKRITESQIIANKSFKVSENGVERSASTLNWSYIDNIVFFAKDSTITEKPFFNLPSVTAKLKRNQIQSIRDEYESKRIKWENIQLDISRLVTDTTTDYIKRERNMKRIAELRTEKPPELDIFQIRNLEYEAIISEQQDNMRTQIEYEKYLLDLKEKRSQLQNTALSGFIKFVVFN